MDWKTEQVSKRRILLSRLEYEKTVRYCLCNMGTHANIGVQINSQIYEIWNLIPLPVRRIEAAQTKCSKAAHCVLRKVCFAVTASICMQDWPLVRDCRAQSAVRYSCRYQCWWSVFDGAIRFICSIWYDGPPHSSAAPGALLWHTVKSRR